MATINIRGERFTTIYDSIRVRWGLPQGVEHPRVMREAAFHIISQDARKRGHNPLGQGLALECSKCGASCSIEPDGWKVIGALAREKCA
jgi:hypothetical protein